MPVAIRVGTFGDEIGTPSFLYAFFSTVCAHCEPDGWGTRFPVLMNELYQGRLSWLHAEAALAELALAKAILDNLPPEQVVWDITDRSAKPPWGKDIAVEITSLGNYFVSSAGRDVFDLFAGAFEVAARQRRDITIA